MSRTLPCCLRLLALALPLCALSAVAAAEPDPLLAPLAARPIGPGNMGGRVCAVAAVDRQPGTYYVATASGGLWKTADNGASWRAVFERERTVSLGDVAVAPSNPDVVWVGTGEANARNSVSWGDGVYKSTDGGKTWKNMGLRDTHHIGKVLIHPKDPDTVYVAALGHVWAPNRERGLFKTTDGGKTWESVLPLDDETGVVDLAMDPGDPDTLYAAAYRVRRDAFSGPNPLVMYGDRAGIYKTTDGGKNWKKLGKGLPERPFGRIGLSVYAKDPSVVYAVVQTDRTDVSKVPGQQPGNSGNVETGGVFRSDDRGATWVKLNDLCPRPFYFGQIRVDPKDDRRVYVLGVPLFVSSDGGKTFSTNGAPNVHADMHALWIDPGNSDHMILGCDGGVYLTETRGKSWEHVRNLPIGQFYAVCVDMSRPYRVYGGLQDNGSWGGPSRTAWREGITTEDWFRVFTADGFYTAADPTDADTVYAEGQYGMLRRISVATKKATDIRPKPAMGAPAYRFNWSSPILLSPHDPKTLYYGGNFLFRSVNRGDTWTVVSPDLTRGGPGLAPNDHTITTIAESPLKAGLLYAGTDDGMVHVSRNGGLDWTDVSDNVPGVPKERWITRVECSPFAEGTAYLALTRYRNDDRAPYLFRTTDYGATWKSLVGDLPAGGPVHVVRCDPRNEALLYVGTEFGLFVSLDGGVKWRPLGGLPTVAVHDVVVHPRDRELVIGTHGRSVYVLDVSPLQELTAKVTDEPAHLFDLLPARPVTLKPLPMPLPPRSLAEPNPEPGATAWYLLREKSDRPLKVRISDAGGEVVTDLIGEGTPGLHSVRWDLRRGGQTEGKPVAPGEYTVEIEVAGQTLRKKVKVEAASEIK